MADLKKLVMVFIKEIQANKNLPESMRRSIPMMLLLIKTNASLKDMKSVMKELEDENKILVCKNVLTTKLTKCLNQNRSSREIFAEEVTEDELFVSAYVIDLT